MGPGNRRIISSTGPRTPGTAPVDGYCWIFSQNAPRYSVRIIRTHGKSKIEQKSWNMDQDDRVLYHLPNKETIPGGFDTIGASKRFTNTNYIEIDQENST